MLAQGKTAEDIFIAALQAMCAEPIFSQMQATSPAGFAWSLTLPNGQVLPPRQLHDAPEKADLVIRSVIQGLQQAPDGNRLALTIAQPLGAGKREAIQLVVEKGKKAPVLTVESVQIAYAPNAPVVRLDSSNVIVQQLQVNPKAQTGGKKKRFDVKKELVSVLRNFATRKADGSFGSLHKALITAQGERPVAPFTVTGDKASLN